MRTTLRKLSIHVFLLLLTLCVGGYISPVSADPATFSANLTVNLIFPASIPGTLTVAVAAGPTLPPCIVAPTGVAGGTCANPTSTFIPATNTLIFTDGPVNGFAGPGIGFVVASSNGDSHTIVLNNLTGAPLMVAFGGNYNYGLVTTAQPGESASASVSFRILDLGTGEVLFRPIAHNITSPPNSAAGDVVPIAFGLTLPPGGTGIQIDPLVEGEAVSGVPEPTSLILLCTGLTGVAIKTRKRLKTSQSRQGS